MRKNQRNKLGGSPKASAGDKSWFRMKASGDKTADIYIYDEIGYWGVTARQFASSMKALGDLDHINLHIHSPGGDVFDGIAIYNLTKQSYGKQNRLHRRPCRLNGLGDCHGG